MECYINSMKEKYHLIGHILEQMDVNPYIGLQIYEDSKFCTYKTLQRRPTLPLPSSGADSRSSESTNIAYITWLKYGQF